MSQRDYYVILGVSRDAEDAEIKSAYRKLALKYHPDRNKEDGAAEHFKEAAEAYAVLSDGNKRRRYDQFGHAGVQGATGQSGGPGGMNVEDIFAQFGDIFGGRGGGLFENLFGGFQGSTGTTARGRSLRARVTIELEDVLNGTERTLVVRHRMNCGSCEGTGASPGTQPKTCPRCQGSGRVHQQRGFLAVASTCPECHGNGIVIPHPCDDCGGSGQVDKRSEIEVKIPAGIEEGAQIRVSGMGDAGPHGGAPGDLYVAVEIRDKEGFHRDGRDLYVELPISYPQAALGDRILVPTLEGDVKMSVPAGTPTGKLFRVRSHGLPKLHGGRRGDLLVRVYVDVPKKLGRDEKNLIKELQRLQKEQIEE
ncbi:MAG: molecular chaperone DnaJ [Planctomycetes bacterium]|nr:molecular chaperone DnaJ [Planctomycetota bacterium]